MSNRFAWAWKLTDLGVPVVLVYLGFLNAAEMDDHGKPFADADNWRRTVVEHSRGLFPSTAWEQRWQCGSAPLIPLIRSREVALNLACAD